MTKVWATFFECAHISENPSFNTKDRLEVVYPHLHGKLTRFPIEFFPLATNSPCFSVCNLPQTVRHFGFSDTAANKIALTLDMSPCHIFPWRCPIFASPTHISAQKTLISGRKPRNAACADISASYSRTDSLPPA
eukprot:jgi/Tetstr1/459690/TSEL_005045.t1